MPANFNYLSPAGALPGHGREACTGCFDGNAKWGESTYDEDGWRLIYNPMSWGSTNPKTLILGFSKGSRQANDVRSLPHDQVAYRGFRPRLSQALQVLGLLPPGQDIDAEIHGGSKDWAFGSLVRCTIEKKDCSTGKFLKSGDVIAASSQRTGLDWTSRCIERHLRVLPSRLRTVVLLSNDDDYVEGCFAKIRSVHPQTQRVNQVAYQTDDVLWVHIVHVGGVGINHINAWLSGAPGKQGGKREAARAAVCHHFAKA
jgi:hypothetical protein